MFYERVTFISLYVVCFSLLFRRMSTSGKEILKVGQYWRRTICEQETRSRELAIWIIQLLVTI